MTTTKDTVSQLAKVPLFSECSQRDLQTVARVVREIPHGAGTVIAREGEPGVGLAPAQGRHVPVRQCRSC